MWKWGVLSILFLLFGCQMTFYLDDPWEDAANGADPRDIPLILRHEKLRRDYKSGTLPEEDEFFQSDAVKYVYQEEGSTLYITFFGTDNVTETYYDIIHWQEQYWDDIDPSIKVHAGFNRPLQAMMPQLIKKVSAFTAANPDTSQRKIYILGHSAGGVHAVLCAFSLLNSGETGLISSDLYCQIGGAPAPGNKAFSRRFNKLIECHRYINGSDQVPYLLTEEMDYYHVGEAYRIGGNPDPMAQATGIWLNDHFISDYADSIR